MAPRHTLKNHPSRNNSGYCATMVSDNYRTIILVLSMKFGVKVNSRGSVSLNGYGAITSSSPMLKPLFCTFRSKIVARLWCEQCVTRRPVQVSHDVNPASPGVAGLIYISPCEKCENSLKFPKFQQSFHFPRHFPTLCNPKPVYKLSRYCNGHFINFDLLQFS